jgi:hypothetical protein
MFWVGMIRNLVIAIATAVLAVAAFRIITAALAWL